MFLLLAPTRKLHLAPNPWRDRFTNPRDCSMLTLPLVNPGDNTPEVTSIAAASVFGGICPPAPSILSKTSGV